MFRWKGKRRFTQRRKEVAKPQSIFIFFAFLASSLRLCVKDLFKTKSAAPSKLKAAQSVFL